MALTISDRDGQFSMPLLAGQELRNQRSGGVNATAIMGFDADSTFLTALEQSGRVTISGVATGNRISDESGFSNDYDTALAEWVLQLEALVNGQQGDGYQLSRDYRNDTINGTIETAEWTRRGGEVWEVGWNMEIVRGDGAGPYDQVTWSLPGTATTGSYEVAGETLSNVREFQVEKTQPFEQYRRAFADSPDENDLLADAGALRRITVIGEVEGTETERNNFDDSLTSSIGQDTSVTVRDKLTGRELSGFVDSYDATDEAGRSRLGEFAVEVVAGQDV